RRDQENESDEPERLSVPKRIVSRPLVRDHREWRVRSPTAFGRTAGNKETDEHDDAADKKGLIARHVDLRISHVRRADLERHDEITEGRERDRNNPEEDHDRAVHRA